MAIFIKVNVTKSHKVGMKSDLFVIMMALIVSRNSPFFYVNNWGEIIQLW